MTDFFLVQASEDPYSSQRLTLGGMDYIVTFSWNERYGWYVGISDASAAPITQPRRVAADTNLLAGSYHDERCPPGYLYVSDLTGERVDPLFDDLVKGSTQSDLRGRVAILYVPF